MKTIKKLTLVSLAIAGSAFAQTSVPRPMVSTTGNPGVLGQSYADLNYSWTDFHRDGGLDADGYIAGLSGTAPVAPGIDVGLGYNYYRENNHRNPFNGSSYDARYHEALANATFYSPTRSGGMRPFLGAGLGYQWSRGDIQSLRTYDHEWVWNASAGAEFAVRTFALTPRITYWDTMRGGSVGTWTYGAQAHHWFTDKVGGYVDATFHDPRHGSGPEWWTYTAGVRYRF